jgi:hypothetical protein
VTQDKIQILKQEKIEYLPVDNSKNSLKRGNYQLARTYMTYSLLPKKLSTPNILGHAKGSYLGQYTSVPRRALSLGPRKQFAFSKGGFKESFGTPKHFNKTHRNTLNYRHQTTELLKHFGLQSQENCKLMESLVLYT